MTHFSPPCLVLILPRSTFCHDQPTTIKLSLLPCIRRRCNSLLRVFGLTSYRWARHFTCVDGGGGDGCPGNSAATLRPSPLYSLLPSYVASTTMPAAHGVAGCEPQQQSHDQRAWVDRGGAEHKEAMRPPPHGLHTSRESWKDSMPCGLEKSKESMAFWNMQL